MNDFALFTLTLHYLGEFCTIYFPFLFLFLFFFFFRCCLPPARLEVSPRASPLISLPFGHVTTVVASSPADGDALEVEPGGVADVVETAEPEGADARAPVGEGLQCGAGAADAMAEVEGVVLEAREGSEEGLEAGGVIRASSVSASASGSRAERSRRYFDAVAVAVDGEAALIAGDLRSEAYRKATTLSAPCSEALLITRRAGEETSGGAREETSGPAGGRQQRKRKNKRKRKRKGKEIVQNSPK
uniref:Uncharacterized protein n=1 Tax=Ananas comosus var. bracteatus TaxID=296719 RepID=A0A6V7NWB6_ANACO|nr:unnamed protein product [Ananas comosus var. bracteatus]